jgi:hypothetical protein
VKYGRKTRQPGTLSEETSIIIIGGIKCFQKPKSPAVSMLLLSLYLRLLPNQNTCRTGGAQKDGLLIFLSLSFERKVSPIPARHLLTVM